MMAASRKGVSIDLSKTAEADDAELAYNTEGDNDAEDGFEDIIDKRASTVWKENGAKKLYVINKLIKCFGSLVIRTDVQSEQAPPTEDGYLGGYCLTKAPNASFNVLRARVLLKENENYDTKDFTLLIASRKWVNSELRPLLELCAEDTDKDLAMRCCKLILVLVKRMRDHARKALTNPMQLKRKNESKEEASQRLQKDSEAKSNAIKQLSALLSFKESLSGEKSTQAITLLFADALKRERNGSREASKDDLATIISYIRRMLAIEAVESCSPPGELIAAYNIHNKFVCNISTILSTFPSFCMEIMNKYHDDWFIDILLIMSFVIGDHSASEMFKVYKEGRLLTREFQDTTTELSIGTDITMHSSATSRENRLVENLSSTTGHNKSSSSGSMKRTGHALSGHLQNERLKRMSTLKAADTRANRLGGVYRKPLQAVTSQTSDLLSRIDRTGNDAGSSSNAGTEGAGGDDTEKGTGEEPTDGAAVGVPVQVPRTAMIVHRPTGSGAAALPEAKRKRSKKNITFTLEDPYKELAKKLAKEEGEESGQRACEVVATLVDSICETGGIAQLVMRVKEDMRREEDRVGTEQELVYFKVIATMLQYYRMKLNDEMINHNKLIEEYRDSMTNESAVPAWEPDLRTVMSTLDKMSFTRVLYVMERNASAQLKKYDDVLYPLMLYKEMICYTRVQLESGNKTHREFAYAALYRLFWRRSERTDPLPRLLSEWKPNTYRKEHLHLLIELVFETLKALDLASARITEDYVNNPDYNTGPSRESNEGDLDTYISGGLQFSVDEYFMRLCSNQTVDMYTRVLDKYAENDRLTTYHLYTFLCRMCRRTLEQPYKCKPPLSNRFRTLEEHNKLWLDRYEEPTLLYMMFNIRTMSVINKLLQDPAAKGQKKYKELLKLAALVARKFGVAYHKNKMLLVEVLFKHPQAHDFCRKIDSNYEAPAYLHGAVIRPSSEALRDDMLIEEQERRLRDVDDDDDHDDGEEDDDDRGKAGDNADKEGSGNRIKSSEKESSSHDGDLLPTRATTSTSSTLAKSRSINESDDDDYGDELDEDDDIFAAAATNLRVDKHGRVHKKRERKPRALADKPNKKPRAQRKRRSFVASSDEEEADDGDDDDDDDDDDDEESLKSDGDSDADNGSTNSAGKAIDSDADEGEKTAGVFHAQAPSKRPRRKASQKAAKKTAKMAKHSSKKKAATGTALPAKGWSAEEDDIIKNNHLLYKGSNSMYIIIADQLTNREGGRARTQAEVKRRIKALKLNDDDDDDDAGAQSPDKDFTQLSQMIFGASDSENESVGDNHAASTAGATATAPNNAAADDEDADADADDDADDDGDVSTKADVSPKATGAANAEAKDAEMSIWKDVESPDAKEITTVRSSSPTKGPQAGRHGKLSKSQLAQESDSDDDAFADSDEDALLEGSAVDRTSAGDDATENAGKTSASRSRMIVDSDDE